MKTPPIQVGQIVETTIDRLAQGGAGVSRIDGFVIFTPFTVPGDLVQIQIHELKKGFATANLKTILRPSPDRIDAACPYFGSCGGCNWQNIQYNSQLRIKSELVNDVLKKFKLQPTTLEPILESPKSFRYRNRIQLHKYNEKMGFKETRSNNIVDIKDCLIAEESVAAKLLEARQNNDSGRIDIRKTPDGLTIITNTDENEAALGFSQINNLQNERMISALLSWIPEGSVDIFLDLYSGSGNLTFPLQQKIRAHSALAVELNQIAAEEGARLSKNSSAVEFVCDSVETFISRYQKTSKNTCVVTLDPPRAGAGTNVMKRIASLNPKYVLYVSCDPMTWARDVDSFLTETAGRYRLEKVQPLDMFPQTAHIEIISMIVGS